VGEEDIKIEDSLTVSGGTYTYKDVKVTDGAIVTLSDSVTLLCDKFEVTGNSRVSINGKLVVYCNEMKVSGDAEINVTGESRNLIFFVKDKAEIEGSANLICILYSPEGEIEIKGTSNVTGQIVAKEVEIKGNAEIEQRIYTDFSYILTFGPGGVWILPVGPESETQLSFWDFLKCLGVVIGACKAICKNDATCGYICTAGGAALCIWQYFLK